MLKNMTHESIFKLFIDVILLTNQSLDLFFEFIVWLYFMINFFSFILSEKYKIC